MTKDKRVKGCPTEGCQMHDEKKRRPADDEFCPKCGARLIFVCKKCFCEIEDIDSDHRICARCEAELKDKQKEAKELIQKGGAATVAAAMALPKAYNFVKDVIKKGN